MRDDPGLDLGRIAATVESGYGVRVEAVRFLDLGFDMAAAAYEVLGMDGERYFLKARFGEVFAAGLEVTIALAEAGVTSVLGPVPTRGGDLWRELDGYEGCGVVLYPFVRGGNAVHQGMGKEQWIDFGETLRSVHESGLEDRFRGSLGVEDFSLPAAETVRRMRGVAERGTFESEAAVEFARFWREQQGRIDGLLTRASELGQRLQVRSFREVLCHADIHAGNILVGEDGRIWLVDWDGPVIGPRERDLLFVVGSRIARAVEPREEEWFFEGYGEVEVDAEALMYFRYERIIEDLGEFGRSVFLDTTRSEAGRRDESALGMGFFEAGGDIERAETVNFRWATRYSRE